MSDDPMVAQAARAAAKALAPQYGARLEAEVEAALYDAGEAKPPSRYTDPVAVSGLIVAIAQLAYPIYSDLRRRAGKPAKDTLARSVRVEWRKEHHLTAEGETIIEIVSAEYTELGDNDNGD
jgi:hypothetical protein